MLAPAADEVSTAIAELLSAHARSYQAVAAQAATFLDEFVETLTAGARAYACAEAAIASSLQDLVSGANASTQAFGRSLIAGGSGLAAIGGSAATSMPQVAAALAQDTALIMGGSGTPIPGQSYLDSVYQAFIKPHAPWAVPQGLATPAALYPYTGVMDLMFDTSVARGVAILHEAITQQIAAGNHVTVFGYSQSATISSLEMQALAALGPNAPTPDQLSFVLFGNPNNPNGGLFSRFSGLFVPSIGLTFGDATPADLYPTTVYTVEYDGIADFPRYPLNLLADLNALAGIYYLHGTIPSLTPEQLSGAIQLPTDGATMTTYYLVQTPDLPLLYPLRSIPLIGNPLADLLQPNLTTLVNLGYGDPRYGYSTTPANVPTPFGLFPDVSPLTVLDLLVAGTHQGIADATPELMSTGLPSLSLSAPTDAMAFNLPMAFDTWATHAGTSGGFRTYIDLAELYAANIYFADTLGRVAATGYATLRATADMTSALAITLPSYNLNLFLDGIEQFVAGDSFGLVNAVGYPLAASTGLFVLGAGVELLVIVNAAETIASEFSGSAA
ncbi:hypothetical protein AWC07_14360 [Mycobacterium gastri]|uniref:PE family protein n=1 Tax=Mycobacterium gastri TaxID=1777 RepID=A0A1X1V5U0_MYCGS|nr:hypothetical protein AWC07_14360 [Mycobacterium gastri]